MNVLDGIILAALVAGTTIGLFQGILRQVIGLVLLYLALVLAAAYYQTVGTWIRSIIWANRQSVEALAFVLILVVSYGVLALVTREYRQARLAVLKHVDQLGGVALGFVTTCVWITLFLAAVNFATEVPWTWHQPGKPILATVRADSVRLAIHYSLQSSVLANVFARLLPYLVFSVKPWTPADILRILSVG
ncbi:MAG: CvpA family protein [Anaerolineae bacterium]|nr:CvpA family protein [Anaerolineae bacterium]